MVLRFAARKVRMANKFYVEVIGADGLKHHMGPFKLRTQAKQWIAQQQAAETVNEKLVPQKQE